MRLFAAVAAAVLGSVVLTGCGGGTSGASSTDSNHYRATHCALDCQQNLAAADGAKLPAGLTFDVDTSKCADWNREPSGVQNFLASIYAARIGAGDNPSPTLLGSFQKAITVSCASYTSETVKHVATILRNADTEWPEA